jgi:uncharacterized protein YjgD (DUF1641 family)
MANPLPFKPHLQDPHQELERRLAAAPREHAEARLVAWDLLQRAHDKGILDLAVGLVGGRDFIATKLGAAGNTPESIAAIRNLISMLKLLAALPPDMLEHVAKAMDSAVTQQKAEQKPPSLWQLFRRATSEEGRRGLSFMTNILTGLGQSSKQ